MVKLLLTTVAALVLVGCEQQYRYFCHDPDNWKDERCLKPRCEINKDCPEYILKGSYINGNGGTTVNNNQPVVTVNTAPQSCQPIQQKGVCK